MIDRFFSFPRNQSRRSSGLRFQSPTLRYFPRTQRDDKVSRLEKVHARCTMHAHIAEREIDLFSSDRTETPSVSASVRHKFAGLAGNKRELPVAYLPVLRQSNEQSSDGELSNNHRPVPLSRDRRAYVPMRFIKHPMIRVRSAARKL